MHHLSRCKKKRADLCKPIKRLPLLHADPKENQHKARHGKIGAVAVLGYQGSKPDRRVNASQNSPNGLFRKQKHSHSDRQRHYKIAGIPCRLPHGGEKLRHLISLQSLIKSNRVYQHPMQNRKQKHRKSRTAKNCQNYTVMYAEPGNAQIYQYKTKL